MCERGTEQPFERHDIPQLDVLIHSGDPHAECVALASTQVLSRINRGFSEERYCEERYCRASQ